MTYLLSLLGSESPETEELPLDEEPNSLCYYVNSTKFTQNIQIIAKHECIFERLVFSRERILFEASPMAHIKVSTFLVNHVKTVKLECQRLCISGKK